MVEDEGDNTSSVRHSICPDPERRRELQARRSYNTIRSTVRRLEGILPYISIICRNVTKISA